MNVQHPGEKEQVKPLIPGAKNGDEGQYKMPVKQHLFTEQAASWVL
jgi:hypothetical protein